MSHKIKDKKNRWRNKTVAFRVSPEEWEQFEVAVKLSGLNKQDYLTARILQRDVVVEGNIRVYKALRDELKNVLIKLENLENIELDELLETINLITITMQGLKEEKI